MNPQDGTRTVYERIFADIAALNGLFLKLLCALLHVRRPRPEHLLGLSVPLVKRLACLAPERRQGIALCPFSLFTLKPEHRVFWDAIAELRLPQRYGARSHEDWELREDRVALAAMTASYAWQLAWGHRWFVELAFGLPAELWVSPTRSPVPFLREVVAKNPTLLRARLTDDPRFWPDLIALASTGSPRQLHAARIAGLQILAAGLTSNPKDKPVNR